MRLLAFAKELEARAEALEIAGSGLLDLARASTLVYARFSDAIGCAPRSAMRPRVTVILTNDENTAICVLCPTARQYRGAVPNAWLVPSSSAR